MKTLLSLLFAVAVCCLLTSKGMAADAAAQTGDPAKQILGLTGGARTKIVWKRQSPTRIMILDTDVGVEKVVTTVENGGSGVTGQDVVAEPFITATGTRVIFVENSKLYVVDTSGRNKRELCPARCAMGVAEDPPGTEWAYYGDMDHVQDSNNPNAPGKLWRVQIDNPKVQEMVWDKTSICWQWAFTRDGKMAAGALPWPGCHIANLPNGSYQYIHDSGCMVGIAPSGKRMLHCTALQFGGEHRGISVHTAPWPGSDVEINLGAAPGVNNGTMIFPAWALYDDRFFVISGPWTGTSGTTRVLFAQFNAQFNGIANWVQVTQPPAGTQDVYPSCWIQSGSRSISRRGPAAKISPVAGLEVKLLASYVKRMDRARQLKPIIDSMMTKVAASKNSDAIKEAKTISDHIESWGRQQLESAADRETESLKEAEVIYKDVATKLAGMEIGTAALKRLRARDFREGIAGWYLFSRMQEAEKGLVDVPGAESSVKDSTFVTKNRGKLTQMMTCARTIESRFPHACFIPTVNEILEKYKMDPIKTKAVEDRSLPPPRT